jgi:hypothetical protein
VIVAVLVPVDATVLVTAAGVTVLVVVTVLCATVGTQTVTRSVL